MGRPKLRVDDHTGGSLSRCFFAPIDIASVIFFRVLFGAVMLIEVWRYFNNGWIDRYYIEPTFHFTYYGFGWIQPWSGNGMYWHFLALGVLSFLILIGLWYRLSTILFFFGFTYVFLLDQTQYLNHFYLISLISLILIFVPAHRSASIDAWWRPRLRSETVPAWALWALRAQMGIAYFYAGVAKVNVDWLRGEPMRMWLANREDLTLAGPFLPVGRLFTEEPVVYFFTYGGLLLDLLIVPALLWRRTRPYAFAAALMFHLMNSVLFKIGIFPWFAIVATLLFFSPDWPRRILNWPRREESVESPGLLNPRRGRRIAAALFTIYFSAQILVPLRHFLYPGSANWTEEGHRFAWHMKLRDKNARAKFVVTDPASGRSWTINGRDYLTRRQERKMATRPDMILQFCHHLADQFRERGHPDVEVRARVRASLNGRKRQLLVDPAVDLAAQERTLRHVSWIVPLTTPLQLP